MKEKPLPPSLEAVPPNERFNAGGDIDESKVSLRIFGDTLDPKEITNLLKCEPTIARCKGDIIPKYNLVAKEGCWILESRLPNDDKLEDKIIDLFEQMTDDCDVWENLASQFRVDMFCGIFLQEFNRGFDLSPKVVKLLSKREIRIGFDIYCSMQ